MHIEYQFVNSIKNFGRWTVKPTVVPGRRDSLLTNSIQNIGE